MNTEGENKIMDLRRAVEQDPENHQAWFDLGMQYFDTDFHEARRCFSRAIALKPFNAKYIFHRGWKCLSADDYEEAMADFVQAIRLEPIDGFKWHYLANSHFFLGNYEQAADYYRMAITMHQKTGVHLIPPAVDWIWMCNMRLGRKRAAQAILDEFITPDIPVEDSDYDYKKRVLLYAGYTSPEKFEQEIEYARDVKAITETYGLANYYRCIREDIPRCRELLERILRYETFHHAFAYKLALKDIREV